MSACWKIAWEAGMMYDVRSSRITGPIQQLTYDSTMRPFVGSRAYYLIFWTDEFSFTPFIAQPIPPDLAPDCGGACIATYNHRPEVSTTCQSWRENRKIRMPSRAHVPGGITTDFPPTYEPRRSSISPRNSQHTHRIESQPPQTTCTGCSGPAGRGISATIAGQTDNLGPSR